MKQTLILIWEMVKMAFIVSGVLAWSILIRNKRYENYCCTHKQYHLQTICKD